MPKPNDTNTPNARAGEQLSSEPEMLHEFRRAVPKHTSLPAHPRNLHIPPPDSSEDEEDASGKNKNRPGSGSSWEMVRDDVSSVHNGKKVKKGKKCDAGLEIEMEGLSFEEREEIMADEQLMGAEDVKGGKKKKKG